MASNYAKFNVLNSQQIEKFINVGNQPTSINFKK